MRRRISIQNQTGWRTDHLRAFVVRAARQAFDDDQQPLLVVDFRRVKSTANRRHGGWASGYATIGGVRCTIKICEAKVDKIDLAAVLHHEFGHLRGLRHDKMRGSALYNRLGNWRQIFAWGEELPLDKKRAACKALRPTIAQRIEHEQQRLARWQTKRKRAETAIRSISRKIKELQRRQARAILEDTPQKETHQ